LADELAIDLALGVLVFGGRKPSFHKKRNPSMKRILALALIFSLMTGGCNTRSNKKQFAFVTNGVASFWTVAAIGAKDAGKKYGIDVVVEMPAKSVEDQQRIIEQLLADQVAGIAISPINPKNQKDTLNDIAANTIYLTHDSDAPDTDRLCYVGMDNYKAGRMCGKLVKEAIPDGGEIMIFVGRLEQLNAKLRRQGVIDELMDRSNDSSRYDEPNKIVSNDKYTILGTRVDQFDFAVAKKDAEQAIVDHPELDCMVGLFAYNPPLMLEAVKEANKLNDIKIVAFDEDMETLKAIIDGTIVGTVVQDPYQYGYKSVELMYQLSKGDKSGIPESGMIEIPARTIRKDNVTTFRADLVELLNDAKSDKQLAAIDGLFAEAEDSAKDDDGTDDATDDNADEAEEESNDSLTTAG
jgi:ribose transport system substrate-binding protein